MTKDARSVAVPLLILALAAGSAASCARPEGPRELTLAWSEEFDAAGPPDASVWGYEVGRIRNQEAQFYTAGRTENARVEGGRLVIEARKEDYAGASYTSASLNTLGKREFFRGRLEVRARIPTGAGSWPAIWMMGANIPAVGWPECGEIDIMENVGYEPDTIYATVHTPGSVQDPGRVDRGGQITVLRPYDGFHVYAVDWQTDRLDFFCDGAKYFTYARNADYPDYWRFDRPFYLLLNLAVGGTWGGARGIDEAIFPLRYEIDYVRYYQ